MKVLLDNVNLDSNSGPNNFAAKLIKELANFNCQLSHNASKDFDPDVQLAFITSRYQFAPIVQRLDGIYFNSDQDFKLLNKPIRTTYEAAEAVIFQSHFNKTLTEKWFGKKEFSYVIHNGTNIEKIKDVAPLSHPLLDKFKNVWCCASSWRPHKRLSENIRYFLENSPENDCLVIAGENPDIKVEDPRVLYAGHMACADLLSLFKRASHFIHLSWHDHCPNVVVDARAAGCHIVCSSSGGTREIAGLNSTVINEDAWDFNPIRLYCPPKLDFSNQEKNNIDNSIDIKAVAKSYYEVLEVAKA